MTGLLSIGAQRAHQIHLAYKYIISWLGAAAAVTAAAGSRAHSIDLPAAVNSAAGAPAAQINDLELQSETVKASMAQMEQGAREVAEQLKKTQGQCQEQGAQLQESAAQQEQLRWASMTILWYRTQRPAGPSWSLVSSLDLTL